MKTSPKQLLVHLDASSRATERLRVARQLGQQYGAAVAALYAVAPSLVEQPFSPEIGPGVAAILRQIDDEQLARASTMFDRSLQSISVPVSWGEVRDYPAAGAFAQQALYADLLVLGQHDPSDLKSTDVPADFAETVMAISGKPAIILPYTAVPPVMGETVVIAWKATREAARAVTAAMPLLQGARRVHVISWAGDEPAIGGERLDLRGYLKLHGVEATWHREGEEPEELGQLLLSRTFDLEADLLVMGCYGHSRVREWLLGGTSRVVLQSMTLPVLMAH